MCFHVSTCPCNIYIFLHEGGFMNDVALVLDRDFCNGLQHCRGSASAVSQNIKDMYDGLEYLQHCKPGGFLCQQSNPANISFTINTDGVALFKSSTTDVWPVFLLINELPPHMR